MKHCNDCDFFVDVGLHPDGECHRKAPLGVRSEITPFKGAWPRVFFMNGCGDWRVVAGCNCTEGEAHAPEGCPRSCQPRSQ